MTRRRLPLVLASASPQRRRLLKRLGRRFRVVPSEADETSIDRRLDRRVVRLALRKARAVAARIPRGVVLGADTLVYSRGRVIGKPKSDEDASRILGWLNGRWQSVYTGVAAVRAGDGRAFTGYAVSRLKARRLSKEELARLSRKHRDKAGAYAVQDRDDPFIERVVGPLDNVIGLPVDLARRLLRRAERGG